MHQHHEGLAIDTRDRRNVADEIEIEIFVERRVDSVRVGDQQQRVSVRRRLHDCLGGDAATGAEPVLDDEWLAELLSKSLPNETCTYVGWPASSKAHNDAHRARGISLSPGLLRYRRQNDGARSETQKVPAGKLHGSLPKAIIIGSNGAV